MLQVSNSLNIVEWAMPTLLHVLALLDVAVVLRLELVRVVVFFLAVVVDDLVVDLPLVLAALDLRVDLPLDVLDARSSRAVESVISSTD